MIAIKKLIIITLFQSRIKLYSFRDKQEWTTKMKKRTAMDYIDCVKSSTQSWWDTYCLYVTYIISRWSWIQITRWTSQKRFAQIHEPRAQFAHFQLVLIPVTVNALYSLVNRHFQHSSFLLHENDNVTEDVYTKSSSTLDYLIKCTQLHWLSLDGRVSRLNQKSHPKVRQSGIRWTMQTVCA